MTFNILAIGDVSGSVGLDSISQKLKSIIKQQNANLVVVNGENSAGTGITPGDANTIFNAGANLITLGNHAYAKRQIIPILNDYSGIIRPYNFGKNAPGHGFEILDTDIGSIAVISLIGRHAMPALYDNPFTEIDNLLKRIDTNLIVVDFHAEATSEKLAMAHYLDGRVSAIWGTHTHIQTSDAAILPNGTGYITDLGMTGPANSVLGLDINCSIDRFTGTVSALEQATGLGKIEGAVFNISPDNGKCNHVSAFRVFV